MGHLNGTTRQARLCVILEEAKCLFQAGGSQMSQCVFQTFSAHAVAETCTRARLRARSLYTAPLDARLGLAVAQSTASISKDYAADSRNEKLSAIHMSVQASQRVWL